MARVGDAFPTKFLSYTELGEGERVLVTIEGVEDVHCKGAFYRGAKLPDKQWVAWLAEYERAFVLKPERARTLAGLFGTDDMDQWKGRQFFLCRGMHNGEGCLKIDPSAAVEKPKRKPGDPLPILDKTGLDRPMPASAMERFIGELSRRRKTWSDLMTWAKATHRELHDALAGRSFDAIPIGAAGGLKAFLDHVDKSAMPAAPAPAARPALAAKPEPGPHEHPETADSEDIPF